ncbi:MAG: heavy metal translocating P-type ATPase [Bacilli bacterium]|nr:heavy metal translocating P-type ATPase [Bacilli bacterium]
MEEKEDLYKVIISTLIFFIALLIDNVTLKIILYFIAYIVVSYEIIINAVKNILKGEIFDENFLMALATIGAICIKEYPEAVTVMLLYQIGELFQDYAVNKSRKSISELMDIKPDYAWLIKNNKTNKVDPSDVNINDIIVVKPGEKIPLDGIIVEGESMLNTVALTGEAPYRNVQVNDEVISGCINVNGTLKVKVTKTYENSTVSKILDLVENASNKKSKSENFITKFAKYYTPIVVIIAVILAFIPPLVTHSGFTPWLYRALSFLVVSCPCALVISVPLSFFGGIGAASRDGILIKGSNYLEKLANCEIIVCDKTGTLTEGVFKVQKVVSKDYKEEDLLFYASAAEYYSNHPIALSLKEASQKEVDINKIKNTKEYAGKGVEISYDHKKIIVGNEKLFKDKKIEIEEVSDKGTIIFVAVNNKYAGYIVISDKIKDDSYVAMELFKNSSINKVVMLTGDKESASKDVCDELDIDEYYSELLPQDKVELVEKLMEEKNPSNSLVFIGDGINDAPVLALCDIGISMGAIGSDAAIEASDVVIMTDEISKVSKAINISKKTMRIVRENIILAIAVKVAILILASIGVADMWAVVFADVGVSFLAILNALRLLKNNNF